MLRSGAVLRRFQQLRHNAGVTYTPHRLISSGEDSGGGSTLAYWAHFLAADPRPTIPALVDAQQVSRLLQEVLQVHSGRRPSRGMPPDEVSDLLVRWYREALRPEERHTFFSLLCAEFGPRAEAANRAAAAWQELRSRGGGSPEALQRAAQELHLASQPQYMQVRLGRRLAGGRASPAAAPEQLAACSRRACRSRCQLRPRPARGAVVHQLPGPPPALAAPWPHSARPPRPDPADPAAHHPAPQGHQLPG
jgi:hypothetical protein